MTWEEQRAALAASHDAGALNALKDAVDIEILDPWLGGRPEVDWPEALAALAETGWRLVQT